jgi:hypothetical protein
MQNATKQERSRNHCCRGKSVSSKYHDCILALVIQHVNRVFYVQQYDAIYDMSGYTGMLKSPYFYLLPHVFRLIGRIFRLMLVLFYIYIYIYIYISIYICVCVYICIWY